ncbi:hypothetical protein FH608_029570 [Nonomuraea phyllanthi]|uniref:Uncharacterized protein n=1 Tax=Nonomuraea phyllanthi TaxID=2219224 RepID=A0A5C4W1M9_9ACTN|nr:hypothetical protein [Nonomuraea phyllanthi]KAB8191416.1 hypothetical protein FH608_029570 [Nonomuraea phyllanthi]
MTETPEAGEIDLDDSALSRRLKAISDCVRAVAAPVTRDLDRREADALLRSYLEPGCFPEAVRRLAAGHLLVLVGEQETGKRLGAIALLSRMSLADGTITVLSPAGTAAELLACTAYEPGRAYLLHDWIAVSTDRTELVDLARKLAELGSYLVITRNGAPSHSVEVERPWSAPDPGELFDLCLRTYGVGPQASETVARARDTALILPTPAEVVRLAARLVQDEPPPGSPAQAEPPGEGVVAAWFDTKPPLHEVRTAAALVFLQGVAAPVFRQQFVRLERIWQAHERRGTRPVDGRHPLLGAQEGRMAFLVPHHREQVLAELVARYGYWLWQPLREWVRSLALEGPAVSGRASAGVALLAAYSLTEVEREFLEAWAQGLAVEQLAAGETLSYMCADDTLAPEALRLALDWSADPGDPRAVAAAVALGGGLAVRYPADSLRRLRELASHGGPVAGVARAGLPVAGRPRDA